jgi:hypothetical protein
VRFAISVMVRDEIDLIAAAWSEASRCPRGGSHHRSRPRLEAGAALHPAGYCDDVARLGRRMPTGLKRRLRRARTEFRH